MRLVEFQSSLLAWFDREGRKHLPWQLEPSTYRVWVSEIMLQQTQVATVIPYFLRFMRRFPDLADLARASEEEVLGYWAGLGYYTRARNLRKAAIVVMNDYAGELPGEVEKLIELPGIGRSTAGAIVSLGLGVRAPILDGNVKRVLSRYVALEGWPNEPKNSGELWRLSDSLTPVLRVGDFNQAMMDLGATLCIRRRPHCGRCPLQNGCKAFRLGLTAEVPASRPKKNIPSRYCWMLVLRDAKGCFYVEKKPAAGVWGGLWSFPQFDSREEVDLFLMRGNIQTELETLPERRHTFSHYHLDYGLLLGRAERPVHIGESTGAWFDPQELTAVPTPVRRLLVELAGTAGFQSTQA